MSSSAGPSDRREDAAAYIWRFACGHATTGGNECADACPRCGEHDLVSKTLVQHPYGESPAAQDRCDPVARALLADEGQKELRAKRRAVDARLAEDQAAARPCECDSPRCEREGCQDKPTPHTLTLTWVLDDPGVVHIRQRAYDYALCGRRALSTVEVSRRAVTCDRCKEVAHGR